MYGAKRRCSAAELHCTADLRFFRMHVVCWGSYEAALFSTLYFRDNNSAVLMEWYTRQQRCGNHIKG